MSLTWKHEQPICQGVHGPIHLQIGRTMENCHTKKLKKESWKNDKYKQSYLHLKSEKQLKNATWRWREPHLQMVDPYSNTLIHIVI